MINEDLLLFIEPSSNRTIEPIIDELTRKITASLRKAKKGTWNHELGMWLSGNGYFGWHEDACGCCSDACDRMLPNGRVTNSLAVHYVAFHRWEIPYEQLLEIKGLKHGEEEPTDEELWPQR